MTMVAKFFLVALEMIGCALIAAYFFPRMTLARLRALIIGALVIALSLMLFSAAAIGLLGWWLSVIEV